MLTTQFVECFFQATVSSLRSCWSIFLWCSSGHLRNNEVEKLEFKSKENGGGAGGARSSAALRSVLLSLVQPGTLMPTKVLGYMQVIYLITRFNLGPIRAGLCPSGIHLVVVSNSVFASFVTV